VEGYLFILLAAALWALITPGSRFLLESGAGVFEIAFWRCAFAWLLFAIQLGHSACRRGGRAGLTGLAPVDVRDAMGIGAFAVIGIAGLYASLPLAVEAGGAALASVLLYTAPAWVAVLAWLLLGERIGGRKGLALVATLVGIGALALGSGEAGRISAAALVWGLVAGVCYASLYLFGKVYFPRYSAPRVFFWALPIAALLLVIPAELGPREPRVWAVLLGLGTISTHGAYLAYAAGLARLDATRASITATVEPVLAGIIAFLLWGEHFSSFGYAGAALIVAAVLLLAARPRAAAAQPRRR
jgi:drug/metabolite transporter, DME family